MPSYYRRSALGLTDGSMSWAGEIDSDSGSPRDLTNPTYLTRPRLGPRYARTMTGRGMFEPGYRIIGTQPGALDEGVVVPRVLKMVSPLTGQGPADPRATGYFYGMNFSTLTPRIMRVSLSVPPSQGFRVVVRPKTAIRRMDARGQGTVGYY